MRTLISLLSVLLLCLAVGCTKEDIEDLAGDEDILEEAAEAVVHTVPRTGVKTELTLIRGQIKTWSRMNGGKLPGSLDDVDSITSLEYPDEYEYDASTGEVNSKTYPEL